MLQIPQSIHGAEGWLAFLNPDRSAVPLVATFEIDSLISWQFESSPVHSQSTQKVQHETLEQPKLLCTRFGLDFLTFNEFIALSVIHRAQSESESLP